MEKVAKIATEYIIVASASILTWLAIKGIITCFQG